MAKKLIAATLLVAMAAWSELTLAPMLTMRLEHMHPRHTATADYPPGQAGNSHAHTTGAMRCCPGKHVAEAEIQLVAAADNLPCGDAHRCCFGQGPQSVPAPANDGRRLSRGTAPTPAAIVNSFVSIQVRATDESTPVLRAAPDLLGMTLRV